jgi:hypothetical protein
MWLIFDIFCPSIDPKSAVKESEELINDVQYSVDRQTLRPSELTALIY